MITDEEAERFHRDGFVLLKGFYDLQDHILPIQQAVHAVIGLVARRHGVDLGRPDFSPEGFDDGLMTLLAHDRRAVSDVYDAVKQLAPFVRLCGLTRHEETFARLRGTDVVGVAGGGCGIRIDLPGEDRFRAAWHQEYPAQFRSPDGITFWSPLRTVTAELGPVQLCRGSHVEDVIPVYEEPTDSHGRTGAYALRLVGEEEIIGRYPRLQAIAEPGDALVIDFKTVHASGFNVSRHARWSMQVRYFNFCHPEGIRIGWSGCYAAGKAIPDVYPELLVGAP